jgi:hypothetical protein
MTHSSIACFKRKPHGLKPKAAASIACSSTTNSSASTVPRSQAVFLHQPDHAFPPMLDRSAIAAGSCATDQRRRPDSPRAEGRGAPLHGFFLSAAGATLSSRLQDRCYAKGPALNTVRGNRRTLSTVPSQAVEDELRRHPDVTDRITE